MGEVRGEDAWSHWLLHERFGGDARLLQRTLAFLAPIRDRVLDGAELRGDEVVLDVGAGDGLVGFGALDRVRQGQVVFTDISLELLSACERIASERGELERCWFVQADAAGLAGVDDGSVDVVTTRSVLCYLTDQRAALAAFARVLRPGGRLSLFEPINCRQRDLNRDTLFGYDATGCEHLAARIQSVFDRAHDSAGSPLLSFDESDLLAAAEGAGFDDLVVELRLEVRTRPLLGPMDWETFCAFRPNPHAPTVGEAMEAALDENDARRLRAHLQPLVEAGRGARSCIAGAYLTARKPLE